MRKIYTATLICDADPDDFDVALNACIELFQDQQLPIEVQFSNSSADYAALVIAYRS